jgi:hypothetical protein
VGGHGSVELCNCVGTRSSRFTAAAALGNAPQRDKLYSLNASSPACLFEHAVALTTGVLARGSNTPGGGPGRALHGTAARTTEAAQHERQATVKTAAADAATPRRASKINEVGR